MVLYILCAARKSPLDAQFYQKVPLIVVYKIGCLLVRGLSFPAAQLFAIAIKGPRMGARCYVPKRTCQLAHRLVKSWQRLAKAT